MYTKKWRKLIALFALLLVVTGCGGAPNTDSPYEDEAPADGAVADSPDDAYPQANYPAASPSPASGGESYQTIDENRAKSVAEEQTITFSLKVDTAAYTNVARYIESRNLPPRDAVRTEELVNYFSYDTPLDFGDHPFALYTEVGPSPFDAGKHMAFVRVKSRDLDPEELPRSNLTFLIDTSGSMDAFDKLPLLKEAFTLLVETLDEDDRVSIVTYAGRSAVVLDSVPGSDKAAILRAIGDLDAGGSTAGASGIRTAYALAEKNFIQDGNNRVILATDGDFNVGLSTPDALSDLVSEKRGNGVYLSILGFGTGNIRDDIMETLSADGNGNYAYIHSVDSAKKVLVDELGSNLFTVADDVKAQVEFNPAHVKSYRLIGYENRQLQNEDFDDDGKDAGEVGVGSDIVVLFELELQGGSSGEKYTSAQTPDTAFPDELLEVRIRYKDPGQSESKLLTHPVSVKDITARPSDDYTFACSVAAFGHLLRDSAYAYGLPIEQVMETTKASLGRDPEGYRLDHLLLLDRYKELVG